MAKGIYIRTEKTREIIRQSRIGKKASPETIMKISMSKKGVRKSEETKKRMSIAQKINASKFTKEHRNKQAQTITGRKFSLETRLKMSLSKRKEKHNQWKGGITPLYLQIRHHIKARQFSSDCFQRDNYTCQDCGIRGGKLCCHHIKHFSWIIEEYNIKTLEQAIDCEELWNINNGITLCVDCHIFKHKQDGYKL